jgi:hypothetical protein
MKVGHRPRADWAGGRPDSVSTRCWTQKQRSGREGSRKRPELAPQRTLGECRTRLTRRKAARASVFLPAALSLVRRANDHKSALYGAGRRPFHEH